MRKAQGISINTIVIAAIALIVLIIIIAIFNGTISKIAEGFNQKIDENTKEEGILEGDLFKECSEGETRCQLGKTHQCENKQWKNTNEDC